MCLAVWPVKYATFHADFVRLEKTHQNRPPNRARQPIFSASHRFPDYRPHKPRYFLQFIGNQKRCGDRQQKKPRQELVLCAFRGRRLTQYKVETHGRADGNQQRHVRKLTRGKIEKQHRHGDLAVSCLRIRVARPPLMVPASRRPTPSTPA